MARAAQKKWISPNDAMEMLFDDPAGSADDFGFALMRPRSKNKDNCVSDLVRAKLAPRQPTKAEEAAAQGWPITAHEHRLILAPGTPEVRNLREFIEGYDAERPGHLRLLAAVLTMRFDTSEMLHDAMTEVSTYVQMRLAKERSLTTLLCHHVPGHSLSSRPQHIHAVVLARQHFPACFSAVHPLFCKDEVQMHLELRDEWRRFREQWSQIG